MKKFKLAIALLLTTTVGLSATACAANSRTYSLNLVANGGSYVEGYTAPTTHTFGTTTPFPTIDQIVRPNDKLRGWYTNPEFTGTVYTELKFNISGNRTFYAKWDPYDNLEYDLNGGAWDEGATVNNWYFLNEDSELASSLTKSGYVFDGWTATTASGAHLANNVYRLQAADEGDMKMTAAWVETHSVAFDLGDIDDVTSETIPAAVTGWANGYTAPTLFRVDEALELPTEGMLTHSKNKVFDGWYDNAERTGAPITEISAGTTSDKTFYAKWIDAAPISYTLDGAAWIDGYYPISGVKFDETYVLPDVENGYMLQRSGYVFSGWYANVDVKTEEAGATVEQEEARIVNVTPVVDEGAVTSWKATKVVQETDEDGNIVYRIEDVTISGANLTVNAKFTRGNAINYNLNGGNWIDGFVPKNSTYRTKADVPQSSLTDGKYIIELPTADKMERGGYIKGYVFEGWYTSQNFLPNTKVTQIEDRFETIRLYAKWDVKE